MYSVDASTVPSLFIESDSPVVASAAALLVDQIAMRCGFVLRRGESNTPVAERLRIRLTVDPADPTVVAERYRLDFDSGTRTLTVRGDDARGVLQGVGRLLRDSTLKRNRWTLPTHLPVKSAPAMPLRGHQLGYRPKNNTYDAFSPAQFDQHLQELIVFGANAIEILPPITDDEPDSPLFTLHPAEMMRYLAQRAHDFGLTLSVWYPLMEEQFTLEQQLAVWRDLLSNLKKLDEIFVPGGDPGELGPVALFERLAKMVPDLHRFHPNAKMWVSPQGFSPEELETFITLAENAPSWFGGVVHGPEVRVSIEEYRERIKPSVRIRNYPDITHTRDCQFPVVDWDWVFNFTLAREPINPRPRAMREIFDYCRRFTDSFITYSEGVNDDLNKAIWSALGWDPSRSLESIVEEYARFFISAAESKRIAELAFELEQNWVGPIADNIHIDRALVLAQGLEASLSYNGKRNWRFLQLLYRAYYDAYTQRRFIYERDLEEAARAVLVDANRRGATDAIRRAREILGRAARAPVAPELRSRIIELSDALFQTIGMQLSVVRHGAQSIFRGANLDELDQPLNDAAFLEMEFVRIEAIDGEADRTAAIDALLRCCALGDGDFLDEPGVPWNRPRLVVGNHTSPLLDLERPIATIFESRNVSAALPLVQRRSAGTLYETPMSLQYHGLDEGLYDVTVVYGTHPRPRPLRLRAGDVILHDYQDVHGLTLSRPVPPRCTRDGSLCLTFEAKPFVKYGGKSLQVAQVFLRRRPDNAGDDRTSII